MDTFQQLKNEFPRIEENVSLKDYSTFRIGGPARYFLRTSDKKELRKIIERAMELSVPFHILGGGSNTLILDEGYKGLIIVYGMKDLSMESILIEKEDEGSFYIIRADACVPLFFLINELKEFTGLEWAAGIPGTLGGAVNGNAGAFNQSISDNIESVSVLEISDGKVEEKELKKNDCSFGYRKSIFKGNRNLIIVSATLKMAKGDTEEIKARLSENINKRKGKQPKGFSIGSIFKNYQGEIGESIVESNPELKIFREKGIIPAGFLIESCELKGKQAGSAKISEEHANFIINLGGASSKDVLDLIDLIKKSVRDKFSIDLKEEILVLDPSAIDK